VLKKVENFKMPARKLMQSPKKQYCFHGIAFLSSPEANNSILDLLVDICSIYFFT